MPGGAPQWVTAELLQEAIEVWQPYYEHKLTAEDALEITLSVGRLAEAISAEEGCPTSTKFPLPRQLKFPFSAQLNLLSASGFLLPGAKKVVCSKCPCGG